MRIDVKTGALLFLVGAAIGAAAALLLAPRSGEETRELLSKKAERSRDYVVARGRDLRRAAEDLVTRGRRTAEDLVDRGKEVAARI
jgi:gas vesicle protein